MGKKQTPLITNRAYRAHFAGTITKILGLNFRNRNHRSPTFCKGCRGSYSVCNASWSTYQCRSISLGICLSFSLLSWLWLLSFGLTGTSFLMIPHPIRLTLWSQDTVVQVHMPCGNLHQISRILDASGFWWKGSNEWEIDLVSKT